jgi:putative protease
MTMKILFGANTVTDVRRAAEAGADEIFIGYVPKRWQERYPGYLVPNRRAYQNANLLDRPSLAEAVRCAHGAGLSIYLTLNAQVYSATQTDLLTELVADAHDVQVDALIVADPAILLLLRDLGSRLPIHISTGGVVMNSAAGRFFVRTFGVSRLVIPRAVRVDEIQSMARELPDTELEVFLWGSGCPNEDGLCSYKHGAKSLAEIPSCLKRQAWNIDAKARGPTHDHEAGAKFVQRFRTFPKNGACGVCALPDFFDAGIHSAKVTTRDGITKFARDYKGLMSFIRLACDMAQDRSVSRAAFTARMRQERQKLTQLPCDDCYYPFSSEPT